MLLESVLKIELECVEWTDSIIYKEFLRSAVWISWLVRIPYLCSVDSRVMSEWWIWRDMKAMGLENIEVQSRLLPGGVEENHENDTSRYMVIWGWAIQLSSKFFFSPKRLVGLYSPPSPKLPFRRYVYICIYIYLFIYLLAECLSVCPTLYLQTARRK